MRLRRRPALLVATAVLVLTTAAVSGPSASGAPTVSPRTADGPGSVTVTLTALAPVVPRPGGTLTVSGVVRNTTAQPVRDVAVRLRTSPTPVRSRDEIPDILAGSAGRTGIAVDSTRTTVSASLAAGATAPFTIAVPFANLGLSRSTPEVVVIGVESLGDPVTEGGGVVQTGFVRTFLPWFPDPTTVSPTRVAWLWPLSSAPARAGDGVFLDDHLGTEVAAGGRLSRLLDAAAASPGAVSWTVDPALLESLADMADGYEVLQVDGALTVGTSAAAAAAFLARLRALPSTVEMTSLAYAYPDVVALHRAGLDVDIALASTTGRDVPPLVLGRPVSTGLAWPIDGLVDDGTLDVLRATGARAVVLSADAVAPDPPVSYTPSSTVDLASGGSPLRALLFDPTLSSLVTSPAAGSVVGDRVQRRQTALAEMAMTTLELPDVSRTLVIAPPVSWSTDATTSRELVTSLTTSPWATSLRVDALADGPTSAVPRTRADYPESARAAELSPTYLAAVGAARTALASLRAVAPDTPGSGTDGLEAALTRCESAFWRAQPALGRRLFSTVDRQIDTQIAQVQVLSRAPVTLPGDSGVFPITVANDLDRPARVGVRITGTPTVRFEAEDIAPFTLLPGKKETVQVDARVIGTGPVDVEISLLTPEGQAFGAPVHTQVRSAAYARAAQWVVGGLFAVLVALLGVNFVRRRRSGPSTDGASSTSGGAA